MADIVRDLLAKVHNAETLEAARAYVDSALLVMAERDKGIVTLENANGRLINAIKAVRQFTGWGLKESKEFVERAPVAFEKLPIADANKLHRLLTAEGCSAKVETMVG